MIAIVRARPDQGSDLDLGDAESNEEPREKMPKLMRRDGEQTHGDHGRNGAYTNGEDRDDYLNSLAKAAHLRIVP